MADIKTERCNETIQNEKELGVAIFCVENIAIRLCVAAEKVYEALTVKEGVNFSVSVSFI